MRYISPLLLLAVAVSACSEVPTRSSAPPPTEHFPAFSAQEAAPDANVIRVPVSGVFFNPCTGEDIAWSGEAVFVERFVFEPGGFHRIDLTQLRATGTGLLSRDNYRLQQVEALNANASFTFVTNPATQVLAVRVVNTTSGDVLRANLLFHVTRNALGEIVVVFLRFEFDCGGS